MSALLTTHQVKEILKVDRITVYRMLNDGRLKGVKIGKQWRFHRSEIETLVGNPEPAISEEEAEELLTEFPAGCVEKVEDLMAEILGVGVTTVTLRGQPLNAIVNPNTFCQCILSSASGRLACQKSWRQLETGESGKPSFHVCHAGLCFFRSPILVDGCSVAWVITGQFRIAGSTPRSETTRITELAERHKIPRSTLIEEHRLIHTLSREHQSQVKSWTPRLAKTIQSILQERQKLTARLQQISDLSTMRPAPADRASD